MTSMKNPTTLLVPALVALLVTGCKPQDQPAKKQATSQPSSQLNGPVSPPQEPTPPSGPAPSPSSGKNGKDGKDGKDAKDDDGKDEKDGKAKDKEGKDEAGKDDEGKDESDELKGKVVVDLHGTPEGTHQPGGLPCKSGYEQIGSFADCGGAICNGNQNVCVKTAKIESLKDSAEIVAELSMTPEGAHASGGVSCPSGFKTVMSVADCGGGTCSGNQVLCQRKITKKKAESGKRYLKAVAMTAEGTHGSAGCQSGYAQIGTAADCGGGTCSGNQSVCVQPSDD